MALRSALRYFDNSDSWMSAEDLAREFGLGVEELLSRMRGDMIVLEQEGRGDVLAAYVCDMISSGPAPLEYCSRDIRDIIISARKHELLMGLEQDLLDKARENNSMEIYKR